MCRKALKQGLIIKYDAKAINRYQKIVIKETKHTIWSKEKLKEVLLAETPEKKNEIEKLYNQPLPQFYLDRDQCWAPKYPLCNGIVVWILDNGKRKQKIMSLNKLFIGTLNFFDIFQPDISMSVACLVAIAVQFFSVFIRNWKIDLFSF